MCRVGPVQAGIAVAKSCPMRARCHIYGVDMGMLDRVIKASDGDRNEDEGTGLGLAGMEERVNLLGGTLEVRSGDDGGTTVHAVLPVLRAAAGGAHRA